jgi:hypothetical protein
MGGSVGHNVLWVRCRDLVGAGLDRASMRVYQEP